MTYLSRWLVSAVSAVLLALNPAPGWPMPRVPPTVGGCDTTKPGLFPCGGRTAVMPLGDSITEGFRSTGGNGYRGTFQDLLNAKFAGRWLYAGSITSGSRWLSHEGHGGWKCTELLGGIAEWLPAAGDARVGLILLDAGTNDARAGASATAVRDCLSQLLDRVAVLAPGVHVLLAQITITAAATPTVQGQQSSLNSLLPGLAASRSIPVRVVDMTGVQLGPDGIHPSDAGYQDMARRWMTALTNTGWI